MIVLSQNLVLSTNVQDQFNANNPVIGYRSVLQPSEVSADQVDIDNPPSNVANPSTYLKWKGLNDDAQSLRFQWDGVREIDYVGVAGHNLRSARRSIQPFFRESLLGTDNGMEVDFVDPYCLIQSGGSPVAQGLPEDILSFSRATIASYIGADRRMAYAAANELRYAYHPITGEFLGIQVEGARENLAMQSGALDNAVWVKTNLSVTTGATAAIDGTMTAAKLIPDTTNATHQIGDFLTAPASSVVTQSWFVSAAEYSGAALRCAGTSFIGRAQFDLIAGTVTAQDAGVTGSIEAFANGIFRISATYTLESDATGGTCQLEVKANGASSVSFSGDGTSGIYAWGPQFEIGPFASSYIPTEGTSVTRNIDSLTIATSELPAFTNGASMMVEAILDNFTQGVVSNDLFRYFGTVDNGSIGGQLFALRLNGGPTIVAMTGNSGNFNGVASIGVGTVGEVTRVVGAFGPTDLIASRDGNAVVTDSSYTPPDASQFTTVRIGSQSGPVRGLYGFIRRFVLKTFQISSDAAEDLSDIADPFGGMKALGPAINPIDDTPLLFRFDPSLYSGVELRLSAADESDPEYTPEIPEIAVVYIGKLLVLPRRIYVGHRPINLNRRAEISNGVSDAGAFLGRVVINELNTSDIAMSNIPPDYFREYIKPWIFDAIRNPFFFAWRPGGYPLEVGYCWQSGNGVDVQNALANGFMSFSMPLEGIVE